MTTLSSSSSAAAFQAFRATTQGRMLPEELLSRRRHPRFNLMERHWRFCLESYQGGPEYLYKGMHLAQTPGTRPAHTGIHDRNLHQYFKEGAEEYVQRVHRSHRRNYSKKVVDQMRAFVSRKPPERITSVTSEVQRFWRNADARGRDIDRFMGLSMQWASVFGLVWIVIDKPRFSGASRDEELEYGMPYAKFYFPFDALDASFNELGELNWILFREYVRRDEDPLQAAPIRTEFVLWDRKRVKRYVLTKVKDGQGAERAVAMLMNVSEHGLGFVPAKALRFTDSDDPMIAAGLLDDVAYIDRSIYNKSSLLDTVIYDQTFSQLVIPTDAVVLAAPERAEGSGEMVVESSRRKTRERIIEMSTKRAFLFNGQTNHPPRYISPDASQAQVIRDTIKEETEEIYRITGLRQEIGREVRTQSGVSKAYDFDKLNKVLAFIAQEMELLEKWLAAVVNAWMSAENKSLDLEAVDDYVQYPRNFDIMGLLEEIDIAIRAEELNLHSPSAEAEIRRRVVKKLFPGVPENSELLKAIMEDIEKWLALRKKLALTEPLDPTLPAGHSPAARGLGGGAPGPGAGPPGPPTSQQADAGVAGMR